MEFITSLVSGQNLPIFATIIYLIYLVKIGYKKANDDLYDTVTKKDTQIEKLLKSHEDMAILQDKELLIKEQEIICIKSALETKSKEYENLLDKIKENQQQILNLENMVKNLTRETVTLKKDLELYYCAKATTCVIKAEYDEENRNA